VEVLAGHSGQSKRVQIAIEDVLRFARAHSGGHKYGAADRTPATAALARDMLPLRLSSSPAFTVLGAATTTDDTL